MFKSQHYPWYIFAISLFLGGLFVYYLDNDYRQNETEARESRLIYKHNQAIERFKSSVDKFAGIVSGMRSFMDLSNELPTASQFQKFVQNQFQDIGSTDSVVVSYIDTSHVFRQSFTRSQINPDDLVGRTVFSLRSEEKIRRLNAMMQQDSLRIFPPINLIEEWVGLPLNFRVSRNNVTTGYVSPILSLKTMLNVVYEDEESGAYVFHFQTQDGHDFDRERIYDDTKVYNTLVDVEYYKNFDLDPEEFIYSNVELYGYEFRIGTANKEPASAYDDISIVLFIAYLVIALLALAVTWQIGRFLKLNAKLEYSNLLLQRRREDMQKQNEELKKLTQTQNKFFSIIGHDMKQPLNAIEGLIYLLKEEKVPDDNLNDLIERLSKSTQSTVELLNNLLRWAMSQTGDIDFRPQFLDLNVLVERIITVFEPLAREKNIKIEPKIEKDIELLADEDMMRTVFRNLVSNAIKFSEPGGIIQISARALEDVIEIQIKDEGIGMSQFEMDTLFELDRQISTVGTSGEKGTGLGLILCKDFVERHGGTIVVSGEQGSGTTFTIQVPAKRD
ncbi:MAG: HAMP domain-containing histidine kinase [Bacteroidia bacterium]|nr:HAMP domain-containing histidine kinase [Bacteroidia bacterium]